MVESSPQASALREAVAIYGSQSATAKALGVTQPTVSYWVRNGRVPPEHVIPMEEGTGISRYRIRPDIYPFDPSSPSLGDGSITGDAPVVLSDRGVVSDKAGDA